MFFTLEMKICEEFMPSGLTVKKTLQVSYLEGQEKSELFNCSNADDANHFHSSWKFAMGIPEIS